MLERQARRPHAREDEGVLAAEQLAAPDGQVIGQVGAQGGHEPGEAAVGEGGRGEGLVESCEQGAEQSLRRMVVAAVAQQPGRGAAAGGHAREELADLRDGQLEVDTSDRKVRSGFTEQIEERVERARFVLVDSLPGTARGDGGYGSTGTTSGGMRHATGTRTPERTDHVPPGE